MHGVHRLKSKDREDQANVKQYKQYHSVEKGCLTCAVCKMGEDGKCILSYVQQLVAQKSQVV